MPTDDTPRPSTADLRFAEINNRLAAQDKTLERIAVDLTAIRATLAKMDTENAVSHQEAVTLRQGIAENRQDLAEQETRFRQSIADHETRLRSIENGRLPEIERLTAQVAERQTIWAAGQVALTVIAGAIAAAIGRSP
jgi:uncharacterized coiled-coil protein SlyX